MGCSSGHSYVPVPGTNHKPWQPGRASYRLRVSRDTAPVFGSHVPQSLGELPTVASEVFYSALPFAVLEFGRLLKHPGSMRTRAIKLGVHVCNADLDDVGHHACPRWLLLAPDVCDDHGAVSADPHL